MWKSLSFSSELILYLPNANSRQKVLRFRWYFYLINSGRVTLIALPFLNPTILIPLAILVAFNANKWQYYILLSIVFLSAFIRQIFNSIAQTFICNCSSHMTICNNQPASQSSSHSVRGDYWGILWARMGQWLWD